MAFPHGSFCVIASKNGGLITMSSLSSQPRGVAGGKKKQNIESSWKEKVTRERVWKARSDLLSGLREAARHTLRLMTNQSVKLPLCFIIAMRLTGQR